MIQAKSWNKMSAKESLQTFDILPHTKKSNTKCVTFGEIAIHIHFDHTNLKVFSTSKNVSISCIFWIVSRIYFLLKEILYILKTSRSTFYWTSCVKEKLKVQGNRLLNNGPWWRRLSSQPAFFSFWIFFSVFKILILTQHRSS